MKSFVSAAIGLLLMATSGHVAAQQDDDEAAIRAQRAASNAAIAAQDVEAFWRVHDDDYTATYGSSRKAPPRDVDIREFEQMFSDLPDTLYIRTPNNIELSDALPLAWEQGRWVGTWTDKSGPVEYRGIYAAGWRKTDGVWKIHSELFVTLSCEGADCP